MNITITGSGGFLGQHLMAKLKERGFDPYGVSSKVYDLKNPQHIDTLFQHSQPEIVFHLAAIVGGGKYKFEHPGTLYYDNTIMNTQIIKKAMMAGVRKFIFPSSTISYPQRLPNIVTEGDLWEGRPELSNEPHAIVKRSALTQLEAYQRETGFMFAYPIFSNCYGPGDRGFFDDNSTHVIPTFIKQLSKQEPVTIWGDGSQTRDFLYVDDAIDALVKFIDIDFRGPLNFTGAKNTSIKQLLEIITKYTKSKSEVIFDTTKKVDTLQRHFSSDKAKKFLDWEPKIEIEEGLRRTIEWYNQL